MLAQATSFSQLMTSNRFENHPFDTRYEQAKQSKSRPPHIRNLRTNFKQFIADDLEGETCIPLLQLIFIDFLIKLWRY